MMEIDIQIPTKKSPKFFICLFFILYKRNDRGIETKNTIAMEIKAISIVNGNLSKINFITGSEYLKEFPKSPTNTPFPTLNLLQKTLI